MAYKQESPYKFLGKLVKGIGGAVGGAVGGIGKLLGGGGGGQSIKMTPDMMRSGFMPGIGAMGMLAGGKQGIPFMKKSKGYTPYKKTTGKSPFKTDAILVKGAYDAASGKGTAKYGQIAPARAWADMVDSVEMTVNRGSKAQLHKDRVRAKRTIKSHDRFSDWAEKQARREHERDRHKQKRRNFRDRYRQEVWDKPPTLHADYQGSSHPHGQYGYYWGGTHQGTYGDSGGYGFSKKEKGYTPYKKPSKK